MRGGSHFGQSPKSGGVRSFINQNMREGQHFLLEKISKFPSPPPPPRKKRTFPYIIWIVWQTVRRITKGILRVKGLRGLGKRPGWVIVLCSWMRHFIPTELLSTQEYKWVAVSCKGSPMKCRGVTLQWTGIPSRGEWWFLVTPCYGDWHKLQLGGPLGPSTELTIQNDGDSLSRFLLPKLT